MLRCVLLLCSAIGLAASASAQLTDLQPGRNFPAYVVEFGANFSSNIDSGDVDNDGDLDVIVANGGDSTPQPNRIFINQGGLQGGVTGQFVEETATRFVGIPDDTSRDMEFGDIDADGDLDIAVANRGTAGNGGEPGRFYVNQGGLQGGTIGTYLEDTDARWGILVSVPPEAEVGIQDGQGPWKGYSCDCEFGDLDDDGNLDLFYSSYGVSTVGNEDSRIFLNNGAGVFHELWPWADPAADTQLHTRDIDLADLDGDFDLDIFAASRDSQARMYVNNAYGAVGHTPFTDVTQATLIAQGVTSQGENYETEYHDLDGDGDFDIWMLNAFDYLDVALRNDPNEAGPGFVFWPQLPWIKGDPSSIDHEVDFLDADGDGDMDAYVSDWSGPDWLYVNGLAQGLSESQGRSHRSGVSTGGSLYAWSELDENSRPTRDADAADLDGDGDPDVMVALGANYPNRILENVLGVPDTHAPTFFALTDPCDKPEGTDTVIHAQVRDNSPYYVIAGYDADLIYSVDAGPETSVDMTAQGSMQFRAVIPPQSGIVSWRVEVTDRAGNTGVSSTGTYTQAGPVYTDLGFALSGTAGPPTLTGTGTWTASTPGSIDLTSARPNATAGLFVGLTFNPTPAFGGMLVPVPFLGPILLTTNATGTLSIPVAHFPKAIPCGLDIYLQYGIEDPLALGGIALSNAVQVRTP